MEIIDQTILMGTNNDTHSMGTHIPFMCNRRSEFIFHTDSKYISYHLSTSGHKALQCFRDWFTCKIMV